MQQETPGRKDVGHSPHPNTPRPEDKSAKRDQSGKRYGQETGNKADQQRETAPGSQTGRKNDGNTQRGE